MTLSAVVIVKDEEKNIRECLDSLLFCDERIVVDSGSADRTEEIARAMGAKVFSNPFKDFAAQKNFGIEKTSGEWVLLVDADERVSPELAVEIKQTLKNSQEEGYWLLRLNRLFGRWMRFGANRHDYQLRLVRRSYARFEGIVHERIPAPGKTKRFKNPLMHYSTETLSHYVKKMNIYTSMEAKILIGRSSAPSLRRMKAGPFAVFFYRMFWQAAILDGLEGFLYAFLSAYYEFVRRAKHWELIQKNG